MKKRVSSFIRQQNSGSAIVIVIVAMAFVGILASTIMWMSLVNFRMKMTDRQIKKSFYAAETVFEQMVVGLQNLSSDAADQSYSFVMQNYSNFSEAKRNTEFQKEYLKAVSQAISKSSTETGVYDLKKLMLYVDAGLDVGIVDPSASKSWIGARSEDSKVQGTDDEFKSQYGTIIAPPGADYMLLKGLHLEYYDQNGYLTIIDTDLMISTPEAGFTQSGRLANTFDYAIIADTALENETTSGVGTIEGNVYAGRDGIIANNSLIVKNADYLITKGNVEIHKNGSFEVGSGENDVPDFWAKGILIDKDVVNNPKLTLRSHSYIRDDLTVNGNKSTVTLANSYYGYGNSESEVEESSAIIINGVNNTLNISGVRQLFIAGHAFTNIKAKSVPDPASLGEKTVSIPMGESIAIKGEQIAYLVPDECVGVLYGQSVYERNPMTGDQYADLMEHYKNQEQYSSFFKEVDVNRQLEAYGGKSLASYGIDEANGIEKVFIPSNGETLVYYYLKFQKTEDAEHFFKDYYELHKEKIDRYAGLYASGGIRSNTGFTRLTMAGDYLTATANGANGNTVALHESAGSRNNDDLEKEISSYRSTFSGLTTALTTNYLSLTLEEKARGEVFENLIKKEALSAYVGSGTKTFTVQDGSGVKAVLTGEGTYTYDGDSKVVLIIANGDVVLNAPFEGIIFADGKVIMKAGAYVTSAKNADKMSDLVRVLQTEHSNADTTKPLDFIRNAEDYVLAGTALTKDEDDYHRNWVDFADIVSYQNWSKR